MLQHTWSVERLELLDVAGFKSLPCNMTDRIKRIVLLRHFDKRVFLPWARIRRKAEDNQRLAGGLGMSAVIDPSRITVFASELRKQYIAQLITRSNKRD